MPGLHVPSEVDAFHVRVLAVNLRLSSRLGPTAGRAQEREGTRHKEQESYIYIYYINICIMIIYDYYHGCEVVNH